ncbi:MAG: RNA 3'-terminal phosphate cyclase [Leptospirales bacterium]|nr:RNA 3'-terminal phosphate cyclase [Leptospirales bacterium]
MKDLIKIDGSLGEGGGQILRSALSLSMLTGRPFQIFNIRKGRKKPGLMRQHLACVQAAAEIGNAEVTGDEPGSLDLTFKPGKLSSGNYSFSIGTAGSCTLLLQTILPALASLSESSNVRLNGGTHNPLAPPFDFIAKAFLPLIARMGIQVSAELTRTGFYPAGGGEISVRIHGNADLTGTGRETRFLTLEERGDTIRLGARILYANLPFHIVERERETIAKAMGWSPEQITVENRQNSNGPGNAVLIEIENQEVTEVFAAFGEHGRSAEKVAMDACEEARRYLASRAAIGEHLGDQLLLPIAVQGKGQFTTTRVSRHALTNMDTIRMFLDRQFRREDLDRNVHLIEVL